MAIPSLGILSVTEIERKINVWEKLGLLKAKGNSFLEAHSQLINQNYVT